MNSSMRHQGYDTVVVGGGCAGVAAAISAARNGARTLIIESGPSLGGELLSGMSIDGAINARGEWIVGGVLNELIEELKKLGGYVGEFNDWRLIRYICTDPVFMQVAIMNLMNRYQVNILLHTTAESVIMDHHKMTGIMIRNKAGRSIVDANVFIDCTGDGDISVMGGAPYELGGDDGELQPISMMFRMMGVESEPLLRFVREFPENVAIGESDEIRGGRTDQEIAEELYKQGQPTIFFKSDGPLLEQAIQNGEMFPTALIMMQPTSIQRKEVCINATRVTSVNGLNTDVLGETMMELFQQITICVHFLKRNVPGFEEAQLAAIAPRLGIRETRRIIGEYYLTEEDVAKARKFDQGVAKGCHHIDIHQSGTGQIRIPISNGGSYDIPFGSLVPKDLSNVLVAGRCLSADRAAQGTARVMGSCLAMGQATGTASAMFQETKLSDMRQLDIGELRSRLREQGAVIDGTH